MIQKRLEPLKTKYQSGPYNKSNKSEQWIRISDGCPTNCPFCYCPEDLNYWGIPKIIRNKVKILDFNILAQPNAKLILKKLAGITFNNKRVKFYCKGGFDKNFVSLEVAQLIKAANFQDIVLAWNWGYKQEFLNVFDAIKLFKHAGYGADLISVFVLCNWKIAYEDCVKKMDALKIWGVRCYDCYYDNQTFPNVSPLFWSYGDCKKYRNKTRRHNQMIFLRGFDPEITRYDKNKRRIS